MIKNERDLWKLLKKSSAGILFDRIENWAVPGVPDLLGYNQNKTFFTLELKLTKANKRWRIRGIRRPRVLSIGTFAHSPSVRARVCVRRCCSSPLCPRCGNASSWRSAGIGCFAVRRGGRQLVGLRSLIAGRELRSSRIRIWGCGMEMGAHPHHN